MSSHPRCASCFNNTHSGTSHITDTPSALIIPFFPHLPRHILLRARDPHIQNQLSGAIHSILAPQWLTPITNGHSQATTPPPAMQHISPTSGDLFSSQSSHFTSNEVTSPFSPDYRPSAPTPYDQPYGDSRSYSAQNSPHHLPAPPQGISPSSLASSMSSWDSSLQQAACNMAESYPPTTTPRAIVKPYRFRFRPILEVTPDSPGGGDQTQHLTMDSHPSAAPSPSYGSQPLTPSAPPAPAEPECGLTLPTTGTLALPRPLHVSPPPPIRRDTLQSLSELQQHPKNALVQRWLRSQSPTDLQAPTDGYVSDSDTPAVFDPPPFPRNSHSS